MCAFGEPIDAKAALAAGIVDKIVEGDLLAGALAVRARESPANWRCKTRERNEKLARSPDPAIFALAREQARRRSKRGQTAPLAAIDAVEAATRLRFDEGLRREAEIFAYVCSRRNRKL